MTTYRSSWHGAHASRGRSRAGGAVAAAVVVVVLVVIAFVVVQSVRSTPAPALRLEAVSSTHFPGSAARLPWPSQGEATLAVQGIGTVGSKSVGGSGGSGADQEYAIASVTKIMAALVILQDHPLSVGATGPTITVTPADVTTYQQDLAQGDSVVAVTAGEGITEYQALEATLLPSGDNIVDILAQWDAGSLSGFVAKMNARAQALGLRHTHYADASGVDPATVSTASDQVRLAMVAMKNPVFAQIVSMPQATLPGVGVQYNVNADLGTDGIVGVKTGWVPQGGASFVFAATHAVSGHTAMIIGAVLGQTGAAPLPTALAAGEHLVTTLGAELRRTQVVAPGTTVATVQAPYSTPVPVITTSGATLLGWPGAPVHEHVDLTRKLTAPMAKGTPLGNLVVSIGSERVSVPVVTGSPLSGPSYFWRLTRL